MELFLDDYSGIKKEFLDFYKRRGIKEVGLFCSTSGLPVAAAACFILEIEPDNEYALGLKQRAIDFYGYEKIIDRKGNNIT